MHRSRIAYQHLKLFSDLLFLSLAFFLSSYIARLRISSAQTFFGFEKREIFILFTLGVIWYFSSRIVGMYDDFRNRNFSYELIALLKNSFIQALAAVFLLFLVKTMVLSRIFILLYFFLQLFFMAVWKLLLKLILRRLRLKGRNLRFILVVGAGRVGQGFAETVARYPHLGYQVVGFVDDQFDEGIGSRYLGKLEQLPQILEKKTVDEVLIALPHQEVGKLDQAVTVCANYPVHVRIIPDYFTYIGSRFSVSLFGDFPVLSLNQFPLDEPHWRFIKRLFDICFSLLIIVLVFSWFWPLLALAIKLDSRGPAFFKQERWGKKNRKFVCYKFRTMVRGSMDLDQNGRYLQATRDDPRVTRVGRWLRRLNIDELPQFINVLKGDMSLIGPRPHPTPLNLQSREKIENYLFRHMVKPGITGWAQIKGFRGETQDPDLMKKRVEHDIWYIENWTFWLDLQILAITIWQMLRGDPRAY